VSIPVNPSITLDQLRASYAAPAANQRSQELNDRFALRLQQALEGGATGSTATPDKAQALAQLLNLQMMQSSLSLAMDNGDDGASMPQRLNQPLQALIASYNANLPAAPAGSPEQKPTAAVSSTQLHDLAVSDRSAAGTTDVPLPLLSASTPEGVDEIIAAASQRYGVDANLIKAVISAESNFNPHAVSHAGAQGLMQLMPGTARSLGVSDSFDPQQNVMGGTRFLRDLLKRYDGNVDSALAAYNWGPGNVDRRPDQLPRETRNYLARVKQLYSSYQA